MWREKGVPTPALDERPTLRLDLETTAQGYLTLRGRLERVLEPIALTELRALAELQWPSDLEEQTAAVEGMLAMDACWLEWARAKGKE